MVTLLCKVRAHAPSHLEHHKPADNTTTWELLQAIANRIPLQDTEIREWDVKRYWLWDIVSIHFLDHIALFQTNLLLICMYIYLIYVCIYSTVGQQLRKNPQLSWT